ncbi:MAG: nuclear transport factor 2 family protein [Pseudomonadota bacterium]
MTAVLPFRPVARHRTARHGAQRTPADLGARVAGMFALIDIARWDALAAYFHDDVDYIRPGYAPIRGLADLLDFYRHRRIVHSGCHVLELLCTDASGQAVSATGSFTGTDRQGHPLAVRFCDVYRFRGVKIARRETFFNAPAV